MSWIENPRVETFSGLNISDLNVDQAWLNVSTFGSQRPLWIYEVSANCHKCAFQRKFLEPILPNDSLAFKISTQFSTLYRLRTNGTSEWIPQCHNYPDSSDFCEVENYPGEFGVYELSIQDIGKCSISTKLDPVNIYLPLLVAVLFYCFLGICFIITKKLIARFGPISNLWKNRQSLGNDTSEQSRILDDVSQHEDETRSENHNTQSTSSKSPLNTSKRKGRPKGKVTNKKLITSENNSSPDGNIPSTSTTESQPQQTTDNANATANASASKRLKSLDAFRGLAILIMIFADDGGGMYYFFEHCTWDGLYVADVAFPWFLWIMGVCIPISFRNRQQTETDSKLKTVWKIVSRSLKLILLGVAMNTSGSPKPVLLRTLRFPGVLQRLGISYCLASILFFFLADCGGNNETPSETSRWKKLCKPFAARFIIIFCVICHTLIIFLLEVPGCPTGYLGPGGLHLNKKYPANCIGGSTGYIDKLIFSKEHIYPRPTAKRVYRSGIFDPEGTLGLLTSLFQVWIGVETGRILINFTTHWDRLKRLGILSITCGIFGMILSGGVENQGWIPINKNLWSLSYVFVTSSLALLVLSMLYILIDYKKIWSGSPLIEPGMNSILLYVGHDVAHSMVPWNFAFGRMNTHFHHLVENLWGTSLWVVVSIYLYKSKVFWVI